MNAAGCCGAAGWPGAATGTGAGGGICGRPTPAVDQVTTQWSPARCARAGCHSARMVTTRVGAPTSLARCMRSSSVRPVATDYMPGELRYSTGPEDPECTITIQTI